MVVVPENGFALAQVVRDELGATTTRTGKVPCVAWDVAAIRCCQVATVDLAGNSAKSEGACVCNEWATLGTWLGLACSSQVGHAIAHPWLINGPWFWGRLHCTQHQVHVCGQRLA